MMYWIYDLPNWMAGLIALFVFVTFGVAGLVGVRGYLGRRSKRTLETNEVVNAYFAAVVGFYGITLGLISVATWQTFADAENKSSTEAAAVEALYRDVSSYPEPPRGAMREKLKAYVRHVIEEAWPLQQQGLIPTAGTALLTALQETMFAFEPKTQGQMANHEEALRQFNRVSELRRLRVLSSTNGLPATIWWIVIAGAVASIALSWFFIVDHLWLHVLLTGIYSGLIGLLIFLIAAMDNPYRGEFSVKPDAYRLVYDRMNQNMK